MTQRFAWITRNLPLKLFSLGLALALYFFVSVENDRSIEVEYPLEYRTADDMELIGQYPTIVTVTLAGPWAGLRSYDSSKLVPVRIDVRDAGPGELQRRINETDVSAPGGMTVVGITPTQVEVTIDRKVERSVAVTVDVGVDKPSYGFEIVGTTTEPDKVRIVGPASAVQGVDAVYTRPVEVTGHEDSFTEEVELKQPAAPVRLRDKLVTVSIDIREEMVSRVLTVPVKVRDLPLGAEVSVDPATTKIEVRGPRRAVDMLEKQVVVAFVDCAPELEEGVRDFEKNVFIDGLPERVSLAGALAMVHVRVGKLMARRRGKG